MMNFRHLFPLLLLFVSAAHAVESGQCTLQIGDSIAVANTQYGKVKGYVSHGIFTFMGIPYGADTSGENRFLPPKPRDSWQGVLPTVFPGNSSPQNIYPRNPSNYSAFVDHWNYDELSEDCLYLNLWTPALDDHKKRPVLVWLHGGGFVRGNGIEQDGYHGENFSKYGDIVFCSLNHRLGPLGFSDLSAIGGEKFKDSGVVGMLDIVFALQWIRDNIENFGGDPGNVTIMGQSGGGAKVCLLAAMPEAKGLFHKAVSLSGSTRQGRDAEAAKAFGPLVLKLNGLHAGEVKKLQHIPWQKYLETSFLAEDLLQSQGESRSWRRGWFSPVADGTHIPGEEFYSSAAYDYPDVPMLFCTTAHEWGPARFNPEKESITFPELETELQMTFNDRATAILKAFRAQFPDKNPIEIGSLIASTRQDVVAAADGKLQQKSPVYMAWFTWESPLFDGRARSFHCLDIGFWFLNTERMNTHTGGGPRPEKLSKKMADALLQFMKTGNPSTPDLPVWAPYSKENGETMILNDTCEFVNDPDREARESLR